LPGNRKQCSGIQAKNYLTPTPTPALSSTLSLRQTDNKAGSQLQCIAPGALLSHGWDGLGFGFEFETGGLDLVERDAFGYIFFVFLFFLCICEIARNIL